MNFESMDFNNIDWHDSYIENIFVKYNCVILNIFNDTFKTLLSVKCTGFIGISNLCFFDDTIIFDAYTVPVDLKNDEFVGWIYREYGRDGFKYCDQDYDFTRGFLEIRFKMVNSTTLSLYCQNIEISEATESSSAYQQNFLLY